MGIDKGSKSQLSKIEKILSDLRKSTEINYSRIAEALGELTNRMRDVVPSLREAIPRVKPIRDITLRVDRLDSRYLRLREISEESREKLSILMEKQENLEERLTEIEKERETIRSFQEEYMKTMDEIKTRFDRFEHEIYRARRSQESFTRLLITVAISLLAGFTIFVVLFLLRL